MDRSLLGIGRFILPVPGPLWQREVKRGSEAARESLSFMSADHHRVRDFAVLEIANRGEALSPGYIAATLDLPSERITAILDELETRMTFLYRDENGNVLWAYPVTAEPTPHRILFSSGEQIYAA